MASNSFRYYISKFEVLTLGCHWRRGVKNLAIDNQHFKTWFFSFLYRFVPPYILALSDYPFKSYQRSWWKTAVTLRWHWHCGVGMIFYSNIKILRNISKTVSLFNDLDIKLHDEQCFCETTSSKQKIINPPNWPSLVHMYSILTCTSVHCKVYYLVFLLNNYLSAIFFVKAWQAVVYNLIILYWLSLRDFDVHFSIPIQTIPYNFLCPFCV